MEGPRVAALFVMKDGCYAGLPCVEVWSVDRDARLYQGPWPVVAHPPCERWGNYAEGGPAWRGTPKKVGDDGGCFASALHSVRQWGGVIEHPANSKAWAFFGLRRPPHTGGWVEADEDGGWTCYVEQGAYGHPSKKATWLYVNKTSLPSLMWHDLRMKEQRVPVEYLSRRQRAATPVLFRDLLLSLARSVFTQRGV